MALTTWYSGKTSLIGTIDIPEGLRLLFFYLFSGFFRDYWIDVEVNRLRDLIWIAAIGGWLSGEYKEFCDMYGYRSVEYGENMKECWKKVYSKE